MQSKNRTKPKSEQAKVLFVDDEASVTQGIRTALRKAPFQVLTANSGSEGLATLEQHACDVVVSDERMPGMSGSEFLSQVRAEYPDTMRMILSGQSDLKAAVSAINEGGIFRFLLKPCEPADLAACVQEALDALDHRRQFQRWSKGRPGTGSDANATLDRALDSLTMAFQPIFEQPTGQVYSFEALVRMTDPDVTHPGQLFGLAEALGRIPEVDAVIRRLVAERAPELPEGVCLFVNVHPATLSDERIYQTHDPLAAFSDRVVLEVTEQSSLHESTGFGACIQNLRQLGYRIALDDLGAGYAGLTSFALLSPEVVKFDMGLIRGIQGDPTRKRLIESMATLCREMDIRVVAEGVESLEEHRCVVELGCDLVQGFLLGKPGPDFTS